MNIPTVTEARKLTDGAADREKINSKLESIGKKIRYAAGKGDNSATFSVADLNEAEIDAVRQHLEQMGYRFDFPFTGNGVTRLVEW